MNQHTGGKRLIRGYKYHSDAHLQNLNSLYIHIYVCVCDELFMRSQEGYFSVCRTPV